MSIFTYIKERISIFDVVSEYVTLKKAGHYYKGCCPFHHEKTASFTVSPHKEICYCFGCHTGGDVIAFISRIENCSQLEAAKLLAETYQIELPKEFSIGSSSQQLDDKKKYFKICELVSNWCHDLLLKSPAVLRYLYGRGIDKACIQYFTIGYFPGGLSAVKALVKHMQTHNFLPDDLVEANILSKGKTAYYSPFEERVIFPITDHLGHHCGFGGRVYKKQDSRAKYYNSRENDFFNKGNLLYGLSLAKEHMQKSGSLFLVEGYTDCVAMIQHGYKNTAAVLGTACSLDHLKKVARYVDYVYVVYDGDAAGQQAILRLAELCWQVELEIRIIQLPHGEDPASCLAKEMELTSLIRSAEDIFHFFIKSVGNDFNTKPLRKKLQAVRSILEVINHLNDPLKQDILLQDAAKQLDVPYLALANQLPHKSTARPSGYTQQGQAKQAPEIMQQDGLAEIPKLEKKIFSAIINDISLLNKHNRPYIYQLLPGALTAIIQTADTLQQKQPELVINQLLDQLQDDQKLLVSQALLDAQGEMKAHEFELLIAQLQKKYWKTIVNNIKIKLEVAKQENDQEKVEHLVKEFSALKQKMLHKA